MKVRSWLKSHTFQSALHMLNVDHLNIDGPPFPVKCVRKFRSALGEEVTSRYACVCSRVRACAYVLVYRSKKERSQEFLFYHSCRRHEKSTAHCQFTALFEKLENFSFRNFENSTLAIFSASFFATFFRSLHPPIHECDCVSK